MCAVYNKFDLKNGMHYIDYQNKSVHSVNMSFYFKAGIAYESENVNGISHLIEHLFFRRLNGITQTELYYQMERIGSTLRGITYSDFIRFDISVSPLYFNEAFKIIIGLLAENKWTEEDIKKEKAVVLKQIEYESNIPFNKYVRNQYLKGLILSKPIMGTYYGISRISKKNIHLWKDIIFNSRNSCFIMTGNFSNKNKEYALKELGKAWEKQENLLERKVLIPNGFCARNEKSDNIIETEWDVSDINISFDVNVEDNNIYQLDILNSILGQGDGSKLSVVLREILALTDEIYSYIDILPDTKRLVIEFSTNNKNLDKALLSVFDEIKKIKNKIYSKDIEASMMFFTCNQNWLLDDPRELNFLLGWRTYVQKQDFTDINDLICRYSKVTIAQLQELAQKLFINENLIITVTNNKSIVRKYNLKKVFASCREKLR